MSPAHPVTPMRRVMILGSPGSGKSRLARMIGARLALPVFHLDRHYHRPGWAEPPREVFAAEVARLAALPAWVIDGNYSSTATPRLRAADTIVYLDVPRLLALVRVMRRSVLGHGRQRADAADGCPERFDTAFLRYVWRWPEAVAPRVRLLLTGFPGRIVILRTRGDAADFVATLRTHA